MDYTSNGKGMCLRNLLRLMRNSIKMPQDLLAGFTMHLRRKMDDLREAYREASESRIYHHIQVSQHPSFAP